MIEEIRQLKRRPGGELQVHGSAALIRTLMARDLVDQYRLLIHLWERERRVDVAKSRSRGPSLAET